MKRLLTLTLSTVPILLLGACACFGGGYGYSPERPVVFVIQNLSQADKPAGTPQLGVSPEILAFKDGAGRPQLIEWSIAGSGRYKFPRLAIQVPGFDRQEGNGDQGPVTYREIRRQTGKAGAQADTGAEFVCKQGPSVDGLSDTYTCLNLRARSGGYTYSISVYDTTTHEVLTLDPTVFNGGK